MPLAWGNLQGGAVSCRAAAAEDGNCSGGVDNPLCSGAMPRSGGQFVDTCLVDCFRNYGLPVTATRNGPFWILRDGNAMLRPWGHAATPVPRHSILEDGRYIVHARNHFFNLWVQCEGKACVRMDGGCRRFMEPNRIKRYIEDPE
eukprot:528719-Pyramimonas_sp.AAC.1